uniref:Uncharacterized protein n=1 Tax=viral metagenome TaxID=1070528 RepID=A0A6C0FDH9_9ZZZZ|tara:strand:+ start:5809 stop:6642 length:834 start_codon:yes stop_codon:yes gene_type:complete
MGITFSTSKKLKKYKMPVKKRGKYSDYNSIGINYHISNEKKAYKLLQAIRFINFQTQFTLCKSGKVTEFFDSFRKQLDKIEEKSIKRKLFPNDITTCDDFNYDNFILEIQETKLIKPMNTVLTDETFRPIIESLIEILKDDILCDGDKINKNAVIIEHFRKLIDSIESLICTMSDDSDSKIIKRATQILMEYDNMNKVNERERNRQAYCRNLKRQDGLTQVLDQGYKFSEEECEDDDDKDTTSSSDDDDDNTSSSDDNGDNTSSSDESDISIIDAID